VQRRFAVSLVAGALLIGRFEIAGAQATQDSTAQGYAPAEPAPAAPAPDTTPTAVPARDSAAAAPAPAGPRGPANRAAALSSLGFVEILSPRPVDRLQRELAEAQRDQQEADAEYNDRQGIEGQVKAMVDVKKQEISTLDEQRKLAEKNKQQGEAASFEAEKKDAERHKQFLEKRVSLHQAEKDAAKARRSLAEARQRALELELELADRRGERTSDAAATIRNESVVRELERKVLEAQRQQAEREKQVADKHQDIAKRRLELYHAQAAAVSGQ
jgi:hypothetical protein